VLIVNAAAAAVNVLFDYLWIFGKLGFPAMHIAGAAWATNLGLAVKMVLLIGLVLQGPARQAHHTGRGCRFHGALMGRLLRFGGPSGVQLMCEVLGFTCFMLFLGRLGSAELTATNLAFNVSSFAFMPVFGLGMAAAILVGQRLGENRDDLAATATWTSCTLALIYMAILSAVYLLAPEPILWLYVAGQNRPLDADVRPTVIVLLQFVAAYNLFDAIAIVFVGAIKGAGDTRFVLRVTLIMAPLLAGATYAAVTSKSVGLYGCWWLVTVWVWIVGLIYFARFQQGRWRQMRVIEPVGDYTAERPAPSDIQLESAADAVSA